MKYNSQYQADPPDNQESLKTNEAHKIIYFHFVYRRPPVLPGPPVQVFKMKNNKKQTKKKKQTPPSSLLKGMTSAINTQQNSSDSTQVGCS